MEITFKEMPLGKRLGVVAKQYIGVLSKMLDPLGICPCFPLVILIDKTSGTLTQQEIANALHLDKTYVLRIVDDLSEKGFLKRTKKVDDRRAHIIKLTEKGKKVLPEIYKGIEKLNKIALSGLSKKQVDVFFSILDKINMNIAGLPAETCMISFNKQHG